MTRSLDLNRGYILVRIDGKGFTKFTKPYRKNGAYGVYSIEIQRAMLDTALGLVKSVDGAVGAYTVSDEISLLIEDRGQDTWYAGRHDKIVSLTAAYATAYFNRAVQRFIGYEDKIAVFDARIVDLDEEMLSPREYFLDRRTRGISNAIGSYAVQLIGHKHILGVPTHKRLEMLELKAVHVSKSLRYGYLVYKKEYTTSIEYVHKKTGIKNVVPNVQRSRWVTIMFEDEDSLNLVVE